MNTKANQILEALVATLDIPESAYDKASVRYKSVGEWLQRPQSRCSKNQPNVYPQGSFRIGTVIRPLTEDESYDLDMGCRLQVGITKQTHTQEQLKGLIGAELEDYRKANGIQNQLEEKRRCWRLQYQDEMDFHMDTVPSIPEDAARRVELLEAMKRRYVGDSLAKSIADKAGAITDNKDANYRSLSANWRVSNSEGYALWFESRMRQGTVVENVLKHTGLASVDKLPAHKWKTPLQRCIQLLKRHRDVMFADSPDSKPISVIINTLAAHSYSGEAMLFDAMSAILSKMDGFVLQTRPRVPNPVNHSEDFADKWYDPAYAKHDLENSFKQWLIQARADFKILAEVQSAGRLLQLSEAKLKIRLSERDLRVDFGPAAVITPKPVEIQTPARPWLRG